MKIYIQCVILKYKIDTLHNCGPRRSGPGGEGAWVDWNGMGGHVSGVGVFEGGSWDFVKVIVGSRGVAKFNEAAGALIGSCATGKGYHVCWLVIIDFQVS